MPDPGTIIAIIQISAKVASLCKYYLQTASEAPAELRAIFIRVAAFKALFESIKFLQSNGDSHLPEAVISRCMQAVTELEALIPPQPVLPAGQKLRRGEKAKRCLQALAWPLKATKASKLLKEIDECASAVNLSFAVETAQSVKEIKTILSDSQRRQVCKWLVQVDPSGLHNQVCQLYEPHTAEWALATQEWKDWVTGLNRCVWVHGIPGAGKTVLASRLFKETQRICNSANSADSGKKYECIYYYCYQRQRNEAMPFLRWILSRLCRRSDQIPRSVYQRFKEGLEPTTDEVLQGIQESLIAFEVVFVVLDAVDESADYEWEDLLAAIRELADPRLRNLRLLATSREYGQIQRTMQGISRPISMDNPVVTEDIGRWVKSKMEKDVYMSKWPISLANKVRNNLQQRARGMFRWAVCQIDCLRRLKQNEHAIESALNSLPEKLEDTYVRIFELIPKDYRQLVRHTLRSIFVNQKLFEDLQVPVNIVIESFEATGCESETQSRFYDEDVLKDVCGCLVRISNAACEGPDGAKGPICASYAHYTVPEFLEGPRVDDVFRISAEFVLVEFFETALIQATDQAGGPFSEEHQLEKHLSWQLYAPLLALEALYEPSPRKLLEVDSELWNRLDLLLSRCMELKSLLLNEPTMGVFWRSSFMIMLHIIKVEPPELAPFVCCLSLCEEINDFLLAEQYLQRISPGHPIFRQPMSFDVLKYFRDRLNRKGDHITLHGSLSQAFALLSSHFFLSFQFLLENNIGEPNFDSLLLSHLVGHTSLVDYYGTFGPDCWACGHLIANGPSVRGDNFRISPLQIAVYNYDLPAVQLLLAHGADPNCIGNPDGVTWEETPLMEIYAQLTGKHPLDIVGDCRCAEYDWEDVHQTLVDYGAFIPGEKCRVTSLQYAAYELNVGAVELLIELGADPNEVGSSINEPNCYEKEFSFLVGKTPLQCCQHDEFGTKGERIEDILAVERLLSGQCLDRTAARYQSIRPIHSLDSEEDTDDSPTTKKKRKFTTGDHPEA